MSEVSGKNGIWFVYDGDCPLCKSAAIALRIKQNYGELCLLNAREDKEHPLIRKINEEEFDLDEGMIIYDGKRFFHGEDALTFMARYGESKGIFNILNKVLFCSDTLAYIVYPWMRGIRNALLRRKKVPRIDNLGLKKEPIFKSVFGADWEILPPVIHKHYANRPYTKDVVIVEGVLDVMCAGIIRFLSPLFWLMRGIPPCNEKAVPVAVNFESDENTKCFHFNRTFYFKKRKPYNFRSRMIQVKDNEILEIMPFGLGWLADYLWEDDKVVLKHKGYAVVLGEHIIPLPITFLLGSGYAEEIPVDENTFDMFVHIKHSWWGKIYGYKGRFRLVKNL